MNILAAITVATALLIGEAWAAQPADFAEMKRMAEAGNATAQLVLGQIYKHGDLGVPKNSAEAVKWYRLAADLGNPKAQYNLGLMYENGEGVPSNYIEAYRWFNLAAAQDLDNARNGKARVARKMTKDQIAEAQRLSATWKPR
jgi:uncharacterized protein